jgi:LysM repeat protein
MRKLPAIFLPALAALLHAPAAGQPYGADVASLRQDVQILARSVADLSLRVEQLERQNADLQKAAASKNTATLAQLNEAVADLNRALKTADTAAAERTAAQIRKLADATNASLSDLARKINARATLPAPAANTAPVFSDDFPKEGVHYTVAAGDTIAVIARKTGARQADIINANKIANPSRLQIGQVLYIPGGKSPQ